MVSTLASVSREMPVRNRPAPPTEETSRPAEPPIATPPSSDPQQQQQPASSTQVPSAQIDQLLSLLQTLSHDITTLQTSITSINAKLDSHAAAIADIPKHLPLDSISEIKRRTDTIESTVIRIRNDVEGRDYKEHLTSLQIALHDTRESLSGVPASVGQIVSKGAPRVWVGVGVVVGFQMVVVGAYVVYKRRRGGLGGKKLL